MKKIGILGGIAWPSTVAYYVDFCRRSERRHRERGSPGPPSMPEMSIESLDLRTAASLLGTEGDEASWAGFDEYHRAGLERLEASGAELAVIASNTAHHRLASIVRGIRIPVVDLFEISAREAARHGARRVLVLGTAPTMSSAVLREAFGKRGVAAAGPPDAETRASTIQLVAELQSGPVEGAAERVGRIARRALAGARAPDMVCLACTELPLAFPGRESRAVFEHAGATYLDTSAAHVAAAFDLAASGEAP